MNELFQRHNLIAYILKITGLIVIGWGIIAGIIVLTDYNSDYGYVPLLALTTVFTPFVIGIVLIGFGELIDLVQKMVGGQQPNRVEAEAGEEELTSHSTIIPFYAEQEVKSFYSNQGEEVHHIEPTSKRDIFKVAINDRTEYVEVGGFSPKVLTAEEAERFSQ